VVKPAPGPKAKPPDPPEKPDPVLKKWETLVRGKTFEEDQEFRKQISVKFGLPYYLPFCLTIGGPDSYASWLDGFADFLDGLNAAPMSDQHRTYVLECMVDARTFLERLEKDLLPEPPDEPEKSPKVPAGALVESPSDDVTREL
jgi:hypothetical protein